MDKTVSATCPKCQTALRIPAEWAGKAVKCKKCGAVVKVKGTAPVVTPAAPVVAIPVAAPLPAAAPAVHPLAETLPTPALAQPSPFQPHHAAPQPVPMVFDPATGSYVPAPPAAPYPYPPQGYAPPGYPYPMPAPGYAPPPTGSREDFSDMGAKRNGRRKKYKKGGGGAKIVLGLIALLAVGVIGGIAFFLLSDAQMRDRLAHLFGGSNPQPTTPDTGSPVPPVASKAGGNPRRMLAISVTKYLYCNPLIGGKNKNGISEFNEAVKALAFRWEVPDNKENNQLFVLTDADGKLMQSAGYRPMLKPIVTDTYTQFLASSRGQDRVVVYFGGHALAKDGKGYLIPTEGDPNEPDTLIPLEDFWAKLKACPAQQKVVLFDVCRLSTDDNAVRPGSEPMTEELEKLLHTPPDGVQVVTSCSVGQTAGEFRFAPDADTPQGSAFLGALRLTARKGKTTKVNPDDPFPVGEWAEAAGKRMNDVLGKDRPCAPKVSGAEPTAVAVNSEEPPAKRFEFPSPPKGADTKDVKAAFALLDAPPLLGPPPADAEQLDTVVVFSADAMKAFKTPASPEEEAKDEAKYPWRKAALKAMDDLRGRWRDFATPQRGGVLFDGLTGKANDEIKKAVEREQKPLSVLSLELSEMVDTLTELKEKAEKDESKFWVATFRFVLAQAKLRLAFSYEAQLALGNVRTDTLPEGSDGWKLVQVPKMQNRKEAEGAKEAQAILEKLAKECKGTPWEVAAKQWRGVSLGLKWQPKKTDADTTADEKK